MYPVPQNHSPGVWPDCSESSQLNHPLIFTFVITAKAGLIAMQPGGSARKKLSDNLADSNKTSLEKRALLKLDLL
jgi:hypothetical protein